MNGVSSNLLWCATSVAEYLVRYPIQHTTYFSPCELLSSLSRTLDKQAYPKPIQTAEQPFGANHQIIPLPFLIPVRKLVSREVGTTRYFPSTDVPLAFAWASKLLFFPQHLLRCYLTRGYPIRMPFDIEQACLDELLRAPIRRGHGFGLITELILLGLNPHIMNAASHIQNWLDSYDGLAVRVFLSEFGGG